MPVENNSPNKRENRPKRNGKRQNFRQVIICHRRPEIFKLGFDPALKFASGSSTMTSCCQCVHHKFATMTKSYGSDNRAGSGSRDPGTQPQLCSPIGHLCETQAGYSWPQLAVLQAMPLTTPEPQCSVNVYIGRELSSVAANNSPFLSLSYLAL